MKSVPIHHHQQQQQQQEENMSNLTTSEASVSSNNTNAASATYPVTKKKRNQPGHPDPEAEVVALSPKTLMATNRFVCEICNKGFQRDQNLQLHRRGHNLPWKLKQREGVGVVRKKVYVCPESSCVHHDPSRALGDLTGIKKHFCRKHGEKKWKCDKCSKRYAVQSDWKAHSKTCGTREYRCDCGTLFSRRDSFITHRAFCDALAEESARSSMVAGNSTIPIQINLQFPVKKEQYGFNIIKPEIPPWLVSVEHRSPHIDLPTPSSSSSSIFQEFHHQNPNPRIGMEPTAASLPPYHPPPPAASPHISATALLQKAAQMGAKSSCPSPPAGVVSRPHQQAHVSAGQPGTTATTTAGLDLSSRDGLINGLAACGNKAATVTGGVVGGGGTFTGAPAGDHPTSNPPAFIIHEMMMMNNPGFEGDMGFGGILSHHHHPPKKDNQENLGLNAAIGDQFNSSRNGRNSEGMTRDFLGLRNLSQSDILSIAGLSHCINNNNPCNDQH